MEDKGIEIVRVIFDLFMIIWIVVNPGIRKISNIIKLMDMNIQAIDRGIEESVKNGYAEARDKELNRLMTKEKFKKGN
jgi:predicted transcriptional regulator